MRWIKPWPTKFEENTHIHPCDKITNVYCNCFYVLLREVHLVNIILNEIVGLIKYFDTKFIDFLVYINEKNVTETCPVIDYSAIESALYASVVCNCQRICHIFNCFDFFASPV